MKQTQIHRPWVNFKELRSRLKFEDVLRHYKVEVRHKGEQHQGPCPLPGHTGSKTTHMFSANLARGIFQCFGCKAKGNILEFAALMEKADLEDGDALRKVAVGLQERFFPEGASTRKREAPAATAPAVPKALPVLVNAPMDFALKDLDTGHPWFADCGISADTVQHFGLGFCSRGLLAERIAIPLHDASGKLIGYAGCVVDESLVSDDYPLYLFPSKRERQGRVLDFRKSAFLYNGYRIKAPCDDLVVVSEFHSAWWLHQSGFPSVVALMGYECSPEQAKLLASLVPSSGRLWIMPDGGKDGERLAHALFHELSPHRFVRWVKLDDGAQPVSQAPEQLKQCLRV